MFRIIAPLLPMFRMLFGNREFGEVPPFIQRILNSLCTKGDLVCANVLFLICGPDNGHYDTGNTATNCLQQSDFGSIFII